MGSAFDTFVSKLGSMLGFDFDFSDVLQRDSFNQIKPSIAVGACPKASEEQSLQEHGFTHIISCLPASERNRIAFLENHFETLFLDLQDSMHEDISRHFQHCHEFFKEATEHTNDANILIHCEVGVSRSVTTAIALIMLDKKMPFLDAFELVRSKRHGALPNIGFASQLQDLEAKLSLPKTTNNNYSSLAIYLHKYCNVPVEIEVLEESLLRHKYDAKAAIISIFGDIPRVVQGARI